MARGFTLQLSSAGADYLLGPPDAPTGSIRMAFAGTTQAVVPEGLVPIPGIDSFARVEYQDLYPGIDLDFYSNAKGQLEYDWIVAAGADPGHIGMQVIGASATLDSQGNLVLRTPDGLGLLDYAPVLYQEIDGIRHSVSGHFVVTGSVVGFAVGDYDHSHALIIDPVVGTLTADGVPFDADEGTAFSGVVAHFTDSDPDADLDNYTTSIDWGDGEVTDGIVVINPEGGYDVTGSHTYRHADIYDVSVDIASTNGSSLTVSTTGTVADAPLTAVGVPILAGKDNAFVGIVASFTDANAFGQAWHFTASIDWGDGQTSAGIVRPDGNGGFTVAGANVYDLEGDYTVRVTITDVDSTEASATATVVTLKGTEGSPLSGLLGSFTTSDPSPQASDYGAAIDWGDGHTSSGTIVPNGSGGFDVSGTNTYADEGAYDIIVEITRTADSSSVATIESTAGIVDAPLTSLMGPSTSATYGVGNTPDSIASGDFDGDGNPDLVTANFSGGNVSVLLNNGDGTFATAVNYAVGNGPNGFIVKDFNGDTNLDVAVANYFDNTVSVLLGNGDGTFDNAVNYSVGAAPSNAIAVGDFDRDGNSDLATANGGANNVSVLFGNGDGTFQTAVNYAAGSGADAVVAGDFDGDGYDDLAAANFNANTVSVLFNNDDGTFAGPVDYAVGGNPFYITTLVANGLLNLVTADSGGNTLSVLLNHGDGSFAPAASYAVGGFPDSIAVGDLNGDGRDDLVAGAYSGNDVRVLYGVGDGRFAAGPTFSLGNGPNGVVVDDFNQDGRIDIAAAGQNSNNVAVLLSTTELQATEGFSFTGTLATFTDANPNASSSDYTATVDWGDGNTSAGVITANGSGGFDVSGTHVYHDEGNYTIRVVIEDEGGATTAALHNIVVIDAPLTANGLFGPPVTFAAGNGPDSIATADFDADGKTDAVVANYFDGTISVLLSRGDGTFDAAVNYTVGAGPNGLAIGDFNHDGKLDVAVGNYNAASLSVLFGNGDGTFQTAVNYAVGSGPANELALGDFDRDGNLDLAIANQNDGTVSVLLGKADGTFEAARTFTSGVGNDAVVAVDVNGDGRLDLAVANAGENTVSVLQGKGDGDFLAAVKYNVGANPFYITAVKVGDNFDLVTANIFGNTVSVLQNAGDGTFNTAVDYAVGANPDSIAIANFNGHRSLVVGNYGSNSVSVLLGNGDGTYHSALHFDAGAGSGPNGVAVGDFRGNGRISIIVADQNTAAVSLLENHRVSAVEGISFTTAVATFKDANPYGTADEFTATIDWGDGNTSSGTVEGDGNGGFVVEGTHTYAEEGWFIIQVEIEDEGGSTASAANLAVVADAPLTPEPNGPMFLDATTSAAGATPDSIANGDFNKDGKLDLAVANFYGNNVSILLGNGDGTFQSPVNYVVAAGPNGFVIADFNGDTCLDIAVAGYFNDAVSVLLNQGNGTFAAAVNYAVGSGPANEMAFGDFDGDGKIDLVTANLNSSNISLLKGNGNGTFQTAVNFAAGPGATAVTAGDFNHDDKLDVAVANYSGSSVSVLLGQGNGTFASAVNYGVGANPFYISAYVRDGETHLVTADFFGNTVSILTNNGDGTFASAVAIPVGANPDSIVVADFNGDGLADLAVGNYGSSNVVVLVGAEEGGFVASAYGVAPGAGPNGITAGDFNGDGSPDLATANQDTNNVSILLNTSLFVTEGQSYHGILASFTDANPNGTADEFTATIDWGDGDLSTGTVTANDHGGFDVTGTHTYDDPGFYDISVIINDEGGASTTSATSAAVRDAALTANPVPIGAAQGVPFDGLVAQFVDADPNPDITDLSATIDWGDGHTSTGFITQNFQGGFDVTGSNVYAATGTYPVVVTINSAGGSTATVVSTATVGNIAAFEGISFTGVVFSVANVAPGTTASINWGDGQSSTGVITFSDGLYRISGTHTYADEGLYPLTATLTEPGNPPIVLEGNAVVLDAPLTGFSRVLEPDAGVSFTAAVAAFTDANPLGTTGDFTATIFWGDGTTSAGSISASGLGGFDVIGTHTYAAENRYVIGVIVNDIGGASTNIISTANVAVIRVVEGMLFNGRVTSVPSVPPGTVAVIDWGDGTAPSAGTLVPNGGVVDVVGSHIYEDEGFYFVGITLTSPSGTLLLSSSASVSDAPLTITALTLDAVEGEEFEQAIATFTDANPFGTETDFSAEVDWGDGFTTFAEVLPLATGFEVIGNYTYADQGDYTVTITVRDVGGSVVVTSLTAHVVDAPAEPVGIPIDATEGVEFTDPVAWFANFDETDPDHFLASIDWGDGNTSDGTVVVDADEGGFEVLGTHTYAEQGDYDVTVTITTISGSEAVVETTANVVDGELTGTGETIQAVEGQGFVDTVAVFQDENIAADAGDFAALIDWADHQTSFGLVTSLGGGLFAVSGTHTYTEQGIYVISVTVVDLDGGASTEVASDVTVANAPLTADPGQFITTTEGTEFFDTVLTFTDGNPFETADVFTVTIDWGDGTPDTEGFVIATGVGTFDVIGDHTYADSGAATIEVRLRDEGGADETFEVDALIGDAALTGNPLLVFVDKGDVFNGAVATFTDANPLSDPTDFTATIDWGDGDTSAGTIFSLGNGIFAVRGTHTYEDADDFTVHVEIEDIGGASTSADSTFTVQAGTDVLRGMTLVQTETESFTATVGRITVDDPAVEPSDYSVDIDWGDGTIDTVVPVFVSSNGRSAIFNIVGTHTYDEEGAYEITLTVNPPLVPPETIQSSVLVTPLALTGDAIDVVATEGANFNGAVAHFTHGTTTDAGDFSAIIDWGDGHHSAGTVTVDPTGGFIVSGQNLYLQHGSYPVRVTIFDGNVQSLVLTGAADVDDAIENAQGALVTIQEGVGFTAVVASFTDANAASHAADFTATINWDGVTTTVGRVVANNSGGFDVIGSFVYAQAGNYAPIVTISDNPGGGADEVVAADVDVTDAPLDGFGIDVFATIDMSTGAIPVAYFTDDNAFSTEDDFTVTIYWEGFGGGVTSAGTVVENADHSFLVLGSHTYATLGLRAVAVTVVDDISGAVLDLDSNAEVSAPAGVTEYDTDSPGANPLAITIGPDGLIYWIDFGSGQIERMNPDGTRPADSVVDVPTAGSGPADLAFDPLNPTHLWFTEFNNYKVGYVDITDFTVTGIHDGFWNVNFDASQTVSRPDGLAFGPNGELYVALFATNQVARFDSSGTLLEPVILPDGSNPVAVTLGPDGFFYVTLFGLDKLAKIEATEDIGSPGFTPIDTPDVGNIFDIDPFTNGWMTYTGLNGSTVGLFDTASGATLDLLDLAPGTAPWESGPGSGTDATNFYVAASGTGQILRFTFDADTEEIVQLESFAMPSGSGSKPTAIVSEPAIGCNDVPTSGSFWITEFNSDKIAHLVLLSASGTSILATEATEFTGAVANFTFADAGAIADDFYATIDWDDDTPLDGDAVIVENVDGSFSVIGTHTYADESAPHHVSVTITEIVATEGGVVTATGVTAVACGTAYVVDAPLNGAGTTLTTAEGVAFATTTVLATFADPAGTEPLTEYAATVLWGDDPQAAPQAATIVSLGNGLFEVRGGHTYALPGDYTAHVTVTHQATPPLYIDTTVEVTDTTALYIRQITGTATPLVGEEGIEATVPTLATFFDSDVTDLTAEFTAQIDWGDGSDLEEVAVQGGLGVFTVNASHTYDEEGSYAIHVQLLDVNDVVLGTVATSATVANAELTANSAFVPNQQEDETFTAVLATFADDHRDVVDDYVGVVQWGDGTTTRTTDPGSLISVVFNGASIEIHGTHTYANAGAYTARVVLFDRDTGEGFGSAVTSTTIDVLAEPPPEEPVLTATGLRWHGTENVAATNADDGSAVVATLQDLTPRIDKDCLTALIHWGDGTTTQGAITKISDDGEFTVSGTHTYADEGAYLIIVEIEDEDLNSVVTYATAIISDATITGTAQTLTIAAEQNHAGLQVASFSDADNTESTENYEATIHWGDGQSSAGLVVGSRGTFYVSGDHSYDEIGTYNALIVVRQAGTSGDAEAVIRSTVHAVQGSVGLPIDFTGPTAYDPTGTNASYRTTFDWDDLSETNRTTFQATPAPFNTAVSHTYVEAGTKTVTTTIAEGADSAFAEATIEIADSPIVISAVQIMVVGTPGTAVNATLATATVLDPEVDTIHAFVNWGDGAPETEVDVTRNAAGVFEVPGQHTYAHVGDYAVTIRLRNPSGLITIAQTFANVTPAAPEGVPTKFAAAAGFDTGWIMVADSFGLEDGDTITIDWGDGQTSAGKLDDDGHRVLGNHRYATAGIYTVTVTLRNAAGRTRVRSEALVENWSLLGFTRGYDPERAFLLPTGEASLTLNTGGLRLAHPLDFDNSPGTSVGGSPMLVYNSDTVAGRPVIELNLSSMMSRKAGTITATLTFDDIAEAPVSFTTTNQESDEGYLLALRVGHAVEESGIYAWTVHLHIDFMDGSTPLDADITGTTPVIVNQEPDPTKQAFGDGWGIAGVDRLILDCGCSDVLWAYGTGDSRVFTRVLDNEGRPTSNFISPAEAFGTLVENADGSFTYQDKFQNHWEFDEDGLLVRVTDVHNISRTYDYDDIGRLTGVHTPDGGNTAIVYAGGGQVDIFEPGGRDVQLDLVGGNLREISDVDQEESHRLFSYDGAHHLTRDQWSPLDASFTFDVSTGVLTGVNRGAGTTYTIHSANGNGLDDVAETLDQAGVATITDAISRTTTFVLDQRGRLLETDRPLGVSETYERDARGLVTRYTDPNDNVTTYTFDGAGDLRQVTNPDGSFRSFNYDATFHQLTRSEDENGNATVFTLNAFGDVIAIENALHQVTDQVFITNGADPLRGLLRSVTDARGNTTTYNYDAQRRLKSIENAAGDLTSFAYDAVGNLRTTTDARGNDTVTVYDGRNQLVARLDAATNLTTWSYNAFGQVTGQFDPKPLPTSAQGNVTLTEYDVRGLATEVRTGVGDVAEQKTTLRYDVVGRLLSTTTGQSLDPDYAHPATTSYAYDALDRRTTMLEGFRAPGDFDRRTTMIYDAAGNMLSMTDGRGTVTSFAYDERNRRTDVYENWGQITLFGHTYTSYDRLTKTEYDEVGNVLFVTSGLTSNPLFAPPRPHVTSFVYDALNRVVEKWEAIGTPDRRQSKTQYDEVGNVIRVDTGLATNVTYEHPSVTTFAYDELNRRVGMTEALDTDEQRRSEMVYDEVGNLLSMTTGISTDPALTHPVTTSYTYDNLNRRVDTIEAFGTFDVRNTETEYDAIGNVRKVTDPLGREALFTYDVLSRRLTKTEAAFTDDERTTTMAYDAANNLLFNVDPLGRVTRMTYDDLNRVRSITQAAGTDEERTTTTIYDAVGNVISTTTGQSPNVAFAHPATTSYGYDRLNHMTLKIDAFGVPRDQQSTQYLYDAANNLIGKIDALGRITKYTYDALNRQRTITEALGDTKFQRTTTYLYDASNNLVEKRMPGGGGEIVTLKVENDFAPFPKEFVTTYAYDALNRLKGMTEFDSGDSVLPRITTNVYDAASNVVVTMDPEGLPTLTEYDALNRATVLQRGELGIGNVVQITTLTYDLVNNITDKLDALGHHTHTEYDNLNRATAITEAVGTPQERLGTMVYDAAGNLTSVTIGQAPQNPTYAHPETTEFEYNTQDRIIVKTEAVGTTEERVTTTEFDAAQNVIRIIDPRENETVATYDTLNRVLSTTEAAGLPEARLTTMIYDVVGNLLSVTSGQSPTNVLLYSRVQTTSFAYDVLNRRTTLIEAYGETAIQRVTTTHYDPRNNISRIDRPSNKTGTTAPAFRSVKYQYDVFGRLVRTEEDAFGASPEHRITQTFYDGVNNVVTVIDPRGVRTNYGYDNLHRRTSIIEAVATSYQRQTDIAYDLGDNVLSQSLP